MPIDVNCTFCGKAMQVKPYKAKGNTFCSRECSYKHKARNQIKTTCFRCGSPMTKPPSQTSIRDFCSRSCNLKTINAELNPTRMTYETRIKIRKSRLGSGEGKSYPKLFGRHLHRIVAEIKLGRRLRPREVVHHNDENKRNASPVNLTVFGSQSEHATLHAKLNRGDA
ncbi:hypothetical protein BP422_12060 [Brevibacillus formosus]|uniref:HNH nuclease domain-containing protein n=1 Tax=Brevibacillus formosus TaxID=54913 RepID=A0A220MGK1_9BACL|nr:hypothetical protein BP422_12060 [Brevibacillus formosus]